MRLYKGSAPARWRAARPTRSTTRRWPASASPAACSPSRRARGSSSCGACSRGWLTRLRNRGRGETHELQGLHRARLGRLADRLARRQAQDGAEPREARRRRRRRRWCWWAACWPRARATTTSRPSSGLRGPLGSGRPGAGSRGFARGLAEAGADRDQQVGQAERDEEGGRVGLVGEAGQERERDQQPHQQVVEHHVRRLAGCCSPGSWARPWRRRSPGSPRPSRSTSAVAAPSSKLEQQGSSDEQDAPPRTRSRRGRTAGLGPSRIMPSITRWRCR